MVAVHSGRHWGVGTVHGFEAGALALRPQGKGTCQRTSSVLVVCQTEPDDADDDDDYCDEGNNAANNPNDNCVHVGQLGGGNLLGQLGWLRTGRWLPARPLRLPDYIRLRWRRCPLRAVGHLGCRRGGSTLTGEIGRGNILEEAAGKKVWRRATNFDQVVVQRVFPRLGDQPTLERTCVAVAVDGVGGEAVQSDVSLFAVQR